MGRRHYHPHQTLSFPNCITADRPPASPPLNCLPPTPPRYRRYKVMPVPIQPFQQAVPMVSTRVSPRRLHLPEEELLSESDLSSHSSLCQIYPDSSSSAASSPQKQSSGLLESAVFCIHHRSGCTWSGQLRGLKSHLVSCAHDRVTCLQCGMPVPRMLRETHATKQCPDRREECTHCHIEFSGQQLESHAEKCLFEPIYCDNKCGQKVMRKILQQHKVGECTKRVIPCRYCNKEFTYDTLHAHHNQCPRYPVICPQGCDANPMPRTECDSHLNACPASKTSCPFREAGCKFRGSKANLEKHMEESTQAHLMLVCTLACRQQQQLNALRTSLAKVSTNYTGTLVWRLPDFTAKMAEAKVKEGFEIISPPFYTSQYGYRLQASLFPNGNGAGEGTHLSIYIKILPGDYDALLKWPFEHTVSFTLYDQAPTADKACNIVESFIPDPTWENFQRPSREPDALGFGFPRFISHELLKRRHFLRDDVLFLRVRVDPGKTMAV